MKYSNREKVNYIFWKKATNVDCCKDQYIFFVLFEHLFSWSLEKEWNQLINFPQKKVGKNLIKILKIKDVGMKLVSWLDKFIFRRKSESFCQYQFDVKIWKNWSYYSMNWSNCVFTAVVHQLRKYCTLAYSELAGSPLRRWELLLNRATGSQCIVTVIHFGTL